MDEREAKILVIVKEKDDLEEVMENFKHKPVNVLYSPNSANNQNLLKDLMNEGAAQAVPILSKDEGLIESMELLNEEIGEKNRRLSIQAILNEKHTTLLKEILTKLNTLSNEYNFKKSRTYKQLEKKISEAMYQSEEEDAFLMHFEKVNPSFFRELQQYAPNLTSNELKVSAYIKLGMKNKEIARLLGVEAGTVKSNINRMKKKFELAANETVRSFILSI